MPAFPCFPVLGGPERLACPEGVLCACKPTYIIHESQHEANLRTVVRRVCLAPWVGYNALTGAAEVMRDRDVPGLGG